MIEGWRVIDVTEGEEEVAEVEDIEDIGWR